jgi:hypothetical protein
MGGWTMLDHASWLGAVVSLARGGPGTYVDEQTLAHEAATFELEGAEAGDEDVEADDESWFDEPWLDEPVPLEEQELSLSLGFYPVIAIWRALGVVDHEGHLTELGWWGVPESVLHAWRPRD